MGVADPADGGAVMEGSNSPAITGLSPANQCSRRAAQFVPGTVHDVAVHSRTPFLLEFRLQLPSVEAGGGGGSGGKIDHQYDSR